MLLSSRDMRKKKSHRRQHTTTHDTIQHTARQRIDTIRPPARAQEERSRRSAELDELPREALAALRPAWRLGGGGRHAIVGRKKTSTANGGEITVQTPDGWQFMTTDGSRWKRGTTGLADGSEIHTEHSR